MLADQILAMADSIDNPDPAKREQLKFATRVLVDALSPSDETVSGVGRIEVGLRADGARWIISIADNGPGMPETAKAHLFEPFKGSNKPGGSGLGVAIAHEIMRAHGGELKLAKSDDQGATFELILPAKRQ